MFQLRYRRRYQRKIKAGQADVITVQVLTSRHYHDIQSVIYFEFNLNFMQDAKDIAIYTAPLNILSPTLINMLHLPTTERFIKALIFCCQYYLQVSRKVILLINFW